MKPSAASDSQSRVSNATAPLRRPAHQAMAAKSGAEYSMRSASSVVGSTGAVRYASLTRIALNENPSTPKTAHSAPARYARLPVPAGARLLPADDATPGGVEDHRAERDAIPGEWYEVVMADVAQQPADAQES